MPAQPETPATRRLLALDGGGIRGVITIEILAAIEDLLRRRENRPDLVLADYFHYVAGTSTGAIIASLIAIGMPVAEIRRFYHTDGPRMFARVGRFSPRRLWYKYDCNALADRMKEVLGADTTLGSPSLRTLLMVVLRNATTDSPWPVSSNPAALFNQNNPLFGNNLHLPLWQLVRASTAAPTFFPPERVRIGPEEFEFVDGGLTTFNNPALQLFIMATAEPYRLQWPAGEDRMLLVSVGTGTAARADAALRARHMHLLYSARSAPGALMNAICVQQDLVCRLLGRCRYAGRGLGAGIDAEIGSLIAGDPLGARSPVEPRLFTYLRYDPSLTRAGLNDLGLSSVAEKHVLPMDSVGTMDQMIRVGEQAAKLCVDPTHFAGF